MWRITYLVHPFLFIVLTLLPYIRTCVRTVHTYLHILVPQLSVTILLSTLISSQTYSFRAVVMTLQSQVYYIRSLLSTTRPVDGYKRLQTAPNIRGTYVRYHTSLIRGVFFLKLVSNVDHRTHVRCITERSLRSHTARAAITTANRQLIMIKSLAHT